jgi:hypothetical protein
MTGDYVVLDRRPVFAVPDCCRFLPRLPSWTPPEAIRFGLFSQYIQELLP